MNLSYNNLEEFKSISINDKELFKEKLKLFKNPNCELSFQNFFMWGEIYEMSFTMFKGRIIVYNAVEKDITVPIGKAMGIDDFIELSDIMIKENKRSLITQVPIEYLKKEEYSGKFNISVDENFSDYIYIVEDLINLSGKKLGKKRNLIKQFKKNNGNYITEELTYKNIININKMLKLWLKNKEESPNILQEMIALKKGIKYFAELELRGVCIKIDNEVVAFAIFSKLTNDTALVHFEKSMHNIKGVSQIINYETAKILKKEYKYVNREQDLGNEGLRHSKRSYAPLKKLDTYILELK